MTDVITVTEVANLVGGENVPAADGAVAERYDPGDRRRLVAVAPDSTGRDAELAVAAAVEAWPAWSRTSVTDRLAVLDRGLARLEAASEEIAVATVLESGKTLEECRGEVVRAIATVRHQLAQAPQVVSRQVFAEGGVLARVDHVPAGVVVVITPWNFPFSALLRKVVPALAMGNAVVAKPSELSPVTAAWIGTALTAAGLPPGVLGVVHGRGGTVGTALVADERVAAVSFTGSTRVGLSIAEQAGARDLKVQLEMGGKNPLVVLADADLDRAVADAVTGGFTAAGQWCVATSRIVVEEPVAEELVRAFVARVETLQVGHGLDPRAQMGALVSREHRAKVMAALATAAAEARVLTGGGALEDGDLRHGEFVRPTVVSEIPAGSSLLRDEIFGPVVAIQRAGSVDEAVALADDTPYGLSASVYTRSRDSVARFLAGVTTGKVIVNRPPSFGDARVASSGRRDSGRGESEGAAAGLAFYAHERAVFLDDGLVP